MTTAKTTSWIRVRTNIEGFHCYPDASRIDPRIQFLENMHRHIFEISVKMTVTHLDRELEFFLVKWNLQDFLANRTTPHNKSCETLASEILWDHLIPQYGSDRKYEVVVSEDGESDGIVEYLPG